MSSEQKRTWRPAPMMIPAICFLAGILLIHALHGVLALSHFVFIRLNEILLTLIFLCMGGFLCCSLLPHYSRLRFSATCYALSVSALFFTGAWSYDRQNNLTTLPENSELTLFYGKAERVTQTRSNRFMRVNTRLLAFRQGEETHPCNIKSFLYIPISRYDSSLQTGSKLWSVSRRSIPTQESAYANPSMPPTIFLSRSNPLSYTGAPRPFPVQWGEKLLSHLKKNIRDPNSYALLAGLSIGNKEAFDPELRSAYAAAGAAHVLAVSGLHVGIIYAIILSLCNLLLPGNNRRLHIVKQLIILIVITIFAALAAFTPSVTRALLMIGLSVAGKILQRPLSSLQTLFTTALLLCIVNPATLFDIGFQLSFCAVLSILTLQPPLQRLLHPKSKWVKYVWSLICTSTAAQLGTAGIAYYYFGTFPYLFLLTNLLVIPLTGLLLYLLCAWLALGAIPLLGPLLLWLMEQIAWVMNQGVILIDKIM